MEVLLLDFDPAGEEKVLVAACFSQLGCSEREAAGRVARLGHDDRVALLRAYVGDRRNRRHRPGRAFERTDYRFELVTDYGAFRDLQRHRMLTMEWQRLGISLGYDMPDLVDEAGLGERYDEAIGRAEDLYRSLVPDFPEQASYAVALAHRIRYVMQFNAVKRCTSWSCVRARKAIRPIGGWHSRCTGRSPRSRAIGRWQRRCPSSITARPTSSVWNPSAGRSAEGRKNLQPIDQELPLLSLVTEPLHFLTTPPPACLMYGSPHAP